MAQLVREVMTAEPVTMPSDTPVRDAAREMRDNDIGDVLVVDNAIARMREHAVRRVPVVEDGRPVGIFSIGDAAMEKDPRSALGDISAAAGNR